jgi:membrane protease YdiL (CAAX protease family)
MAVPLAIGLRVAHGFLFFTFLAATFAFHPFRRWPWLLLAPLIGYFLVVAFSPKLRRSLCWLRAGSVSFPAIAAAVVMAAATSITLLVFNHLARPDLHEFRAVIPLQSFGTILAAIVFSVVNATLEELVFRGILFDALDVQWGKWVTLNATAFLFGLGHLHGYPPGWIGICLAAVFGFAVGALRWWTGGLALPIAAHVAADATICSIVLRAN